MDNVNPDSVFLAQIKVISRQITGTFFINSVATICKYMYAICETVHTHTHTSHKDLMDVTWDMHDLTVIAWTLGDFFFELTNIKRNKVQIKAL